MASSKPRGRTQSRASIQSEKYLELFESLSPLIEAHDLDEIASAACELIAGALEVQACSILLYDPKRRGLGLIGATHIPRSKWKKMFAPLDSGLAGRAFTTGKPLLLRTAKEFAAYGLSPSARYPNASCVVAPLIIKDRPRGVINITNPKRGGGFNRGDVKLIEAAARLVAGGFANSLQFTETFEVLEHLEEVFAGLHVGVIALDKRKRITRWNARFRDLLSQPRARLKGRELSKVIEPAVFAVCGPHLGKCDCGSSVCRERITRNLAGGEQKLEVTISPFRGSGAGVGGYLLVVEDVGQLEDIQRLREADSIKSAFLRIISHELRTPLTVIRSAMPMLRECCKSTNGASGQRLARVESLVRTNVQKLSGLINGILDIVEIENGTLQLALRMLELNELLSARVDQFRDTADKKGLTWKLRLAPEPIALEADRQRLDQIFYELLDNAIKFSPAGGEIGVETQCHEGRAVVRIFNAGEPISPAEREEIFEKFYQTDQSNTRQAGGTGLGLFLAREIARLHQGTLRIVDGGGPATGFELSLPVRAEAKE